MNSYTICCQYNERSIEAVKDAVKCGHNLSIINVKNWFLEFIHEYLLFVQKGVPLQANISFVEV